MAGRWIRAGREIDLVNANGIVLGYVVKSFLGRRGWWACLERGDWHECYPTRAAAMRAVQGRTDPKKGYFAV